MFDLWCAMYIQCFTLAWLVYIAFDGGIFPNINGVIKKC